MIQILKANPRDISPLPKREALFSCTLHIRLPCTEAVTQGKVWGKDRAGEMYRKEPGEEKSKAGRQQEPGSSKSACYEVPLWSRAGPSSRDPGSPTPQLSPRGGTACLGGSGGDGWALWEGQRLREGVALTSLEMLLQLAELPLCRQLVDGQSWVGKGTGLGQWQAAARGMGHAAFPTGTVHASHHTPRPCYSLSSVAGRADTSLPLCRLVRVVECFREKPAWLEGRRVKACMTLH